MSCTYIQFPKTYALDECYYALIVRFLRYEILTNSHQYAPIMGLKNFAADVEKKRWYAVSSGCFGFEYYCGGKDTYPQFVKCLYQVRELLLGFGDDIPPEWKEKLKVVPEDDVSIHYPVKNVIYWLDCLRQAVDEYKPNIGVTTFSSAPE